MGIILVLRQIPNAMLLDLRTKKETGRELGKVKSIDIDKSYEGIHFLLIGFWTKLKTWQEGNRYKRSI